jgi:hypothetical protein
MFTQDGRFYPLQIPGAHLIGLGLLYQLRRSTHLEPAWHSARQNVRPHFDVRDLWLIPSSSPQTFPLCVLVQWLFGMRKFLLHTRWSHGLYE